MTRGFLNPPLALLLLQQRRDGGKDAAQRGADGGVLVQHYATTLEDGTPSFIERPVAYYGRRLQDAEKNYTVTEIELLAVVECLKHWRGYLWGRKFHLITDHAALKWLHTMRDTAEGGVSSRLTRWVMRLQEYQFDVTHKPGLLHQDADALSRLCGAATPVPQTVAACTPLQLRADRLMATGPTPEAFEAFLAQERGWAVAAVTASPVASVLTSTQVTEGDSASNPSREVARQHLAQALRRQVVRRPKAPSRRATT